MSLINCPECGKEISSSAKTCPHCGYKTCTRKPAAIIILAVIGGIIAFLVILSGVLDLSKTKDNGAAKTSIDATKQTNPLIDKYYMGNSDLHVYVIRFSSDNTVEVVDAGLGRKTDKLKKAYGTYELKKSALVVNLDNDVELTGQIHDDGDSIVLDNEDFNTVDPDKLSSRTLDYFD